MTHLNYGTYTDCMQKYLEDVLAYYKNSEAPSFSKWPTKEIGWEKAPRKNDKFYSFAKKWFEKRGINIIRYNNSNRYLSTFILAAEYPPALGFQEHIETLVQRNGWLSLYRSPKYYLETYVDSLVLSDLTVAERQFLKKESEGFVAFFELVNILAKIRFLLGKYSSLNEISVKLATDEDMDIDLVQRIVSTYEHLLIPSQDDAKAITMPSFEYCLIKNSEDFQLKIQHNLNKKVQIALPSSINLNRFSLASVTALSNGEKLPIFSTSEAVSIEVKNNQIIADFGLSNQYFSLQKRNLGLKEIIFFITVKNVHNELTTINLGKIQRNEDFLVFDKKGKEIIDAQRSFKMGQKLYFVPLSPIIGKAFKTSYHFEQLSCSSLPVFILKDSPEEVKLLNNITLSFCEVPFTIEMREQTPWELAFVKQGKARSYFFSSNITFHLKYDFEDAPSPNIALYRIISLDGEARRIQLDFIFKDNRITFKKPIASPGLYELVVYFNKRSIRRKYIRLLPIKSVIMLGEKSLSLRLFKPPRDFKLSKDQDYNFSIENDKVILSFQHYGKHVIEAIYKYKSIGLSGKSAIATIMIKLNFKTQQEVVGHFSDIFVGVSSFKHSIKKDFLPGSYLEFRKSTLRESKDFYIVNAYMEGDISKGLYPKHNKYTVKGENTYHLSHIQEVVTKHNYSRLLLEVKCNDELLFQSEFSDDLMYSNSLADELNEGYYNQILALDVATFEKEAFDNIDDIPENSIMYGIIKNDDGHTEIVTHGEYNPRCLFKRRSSLDEMLIIVTNDCYTVAEKLEYIEKVLNNPESAYDFTNWFTKAVKWDYPHDIPPLVRIIQDFPLIAVWADVARLSDSLDTRIPLIDRKAKFSYEIDDYTIPNARNLSSSPFFTPELITLNDFRTLEIMGLMIGIDVGIKKATLFYMAPFSERGKPVLSWISLFWIRYIAEQNNLSNEVQICWEKFGKNLAKNVHNIDLSDQSKIPKFKNDSRKEQSIGKLFADEQKHYNNKITSVIHSLINFFKILNETTFTSGLVETLDLKPLMYSKPYIEGFQNSSKWKCIIFLSLYAVCYQVDKKTILERLENLYPLSKEEYIYLIKWVSTNTETSYIYNAYYEYWMLLFWEKDNV